MFRLRLNKVPNFLLAVLLLSLLSGFSVRSEKLEAAEKLKDGIYSIPVGLWNASKNEASMGNKSLYQTGKLVVSEGNAVLFMMFTGMEFSGMSGYLMQLDLMENIQFNEFNYPKDYTLIPAEVISTYAVVDEFNSPQSADINCAGKWYPKVVSLPVETGAEYTWIHVYVPVMGSLGFGDQVCRIKLSYDGLQKMTEVDKELWEEQEQDEAENGGKEEDGQSENTDNKEPSVNKPETDRGEGTDLPNNENDTKTEEGSEEDPNHTTKTGNTEKDSNMEKDNNTEKDHNADSQTDKSELNKVITGAEAILKKKEEFTEASLTKLQAAVEAAKKVVNSTAATQNMLDAQLAVLQKTIKETVKKSAELLDKENLKDGKYSISIDLWHATSDKASMGNPAFNHEALLTVEKGTYTLEISTRPMTVGTITACLQTLQIKQADGSYQYAAITARNNPDGQPSIFKLQLPSREEYIEVLIDPKVEVMGEDPLPARLKISWDTLTALDDGAVMKESTKVNTVGLKSSSLDITDQATGVRTAADENILPDGAAMKVTVIKAGEEYQRAEKLLAGTGTLLALYDISFTTQDSEAEPAGMVQIYLPVPGNLAPEKTVVYRIEGSTKTLMSGKAESGYFVFATNHFSLFALAAAKDREDKVETAMEITGSFTQDGVEQDIMEAAKESAGQSMVQKTAEEYSSLSAAAPGEKAAIIILGISAACSITITVLVILIIIKSAGKKRRQHE